MFIVIRVLQWLAFIRFSTVYTRKAFLSNHQKGQYCFQIYLKTWNKYQWTPLPHQWVTKLLSKGHEILWTYAWRALCHSATLQRLLCQAVYERWCESRSRCYCKRSPIPAGNFGSEKRRQNPMPLFGASQWKEFSLTTACFARSVSRPAVINSKLEMGKNKFTCSLRLLINLRWRAYLL